MLSIAKTSIKRAVEWLPLSVQSSFWAIAARRWPSRSGDAEAMTRIRGVLGRSLSVKAGPFAGMQYVPSSYCSTLLPKIIGTYEKELQSELAGLMGRPFDLIVDIGAAEGYYAVGMAIRCPSARVVAFESEPAARCLLRQLAKRNAVSDRLSVEHTCTTQLLGRSLSSGENVLVISDCEGAEHELLDPVLLPALRKATILVEVHEFCVPGVSDELVGRFAASHDIRRIQAVERTVADWPISHNGYSSGDMLVAMDEERPTGMEWFLIDPGSRPD